MALSPRVKALLNERGISGYEDTEELESERQISANVQDMLAKRKKQIAKYDKANDKQIDKRQYSVYGNDDRTLYRSHMAGMAQEYAKSLAKERQKETSDK